jgi:hypothetical protein
MAGTCGQTQITPSLWIQHVEIRAIDKSITADSAGSRRLAHLTGTVGQIEGDRPWRNSRAGGWSGLRRISILVQEAETRGLPCWLLSPSRALLEHLKQSKVSQDSVDGVTQGTESGDFDQTVRLSWVKQVPCPRWTPCERKKIARFWILGGERD